MTANNHRSILLRWTHKLKLMHKGFIRFTHRSLSSIQAFSSVLMLLSVIASIVSLVCLVIHAGYEHTYSEYLTIRHILRAAQGIFITNVVFNLIFNLAHTVRQTRSVKWIVDIAILVTLLPWIYPHPQNPWLPWLEQILYSNILLYSALAAYAILTLSYAMLRMVGKRTNPSLLLSGSFFAFIIIGSFLLMLPKCTYGGIDYIDALFVSTSAVCITGLTPIDVSVTFTPLGLLILAFLIQIGALGVMTFTSFFALFFSGSTSIYSQLMLKDMIYSKSMNALIPTLLYILSFTLAVELLGAVFIFLSIHDTMSLPLDKEILFSLFHSLSAFCNAGFSNIPGGMSNPLLLHGNLSIYWIMSALIIAGSIGFPILVNYKDALHQYIRDIWRKLRRRNTEIRPVHIYNMNTKIVLFTFTMLFLVGAVLFFILEYDNTLAGMTLGERITQSVFNSATPRSAGFSSVNPARFLNVTLVLVLFLMWVGGASQSTGGGIKVNTFAAIWLNLRAILTGAPKVTAFRRTVSIGSVRRANAVVAISILSYLIFSLLVVGFDPDLPVRDLLFETLSALFTVGSSLGVTDRLSDASEITLSIAMFLGRVGLISLLSGLMRHRHVPGVTYPSDNIIIN